MTDSPPSSTFRLNASREGEEARLALIGELDLSVREDLLAAIASALASAPAALVLDLASLAFVDSAGLAAILLASRLADEAGIPLRVTPGPTAVQRRFELAGLTALLPFLAGSGATPPPAL